MSLGQSNAVELDSVRRLGPYSISDRAKENLRRVKVARIRNVVNLTLRVPNAKGSGEEISDEELVTILNHTDRLPNIRTLRLHM